MDWLNSSNTMDAIDLGVNWQAPVTPEAPSGPDMEYEAAYAELEAAATTTPEQQYGQTVIAGKKADWQQVLALATALSQQTRDVRIILLLTRALTHLHGLPGLLYGLQACVAVLEHVWDSVHPQLQHDGEHDPQMRFNALSEFGAMDGLAADLRQSVALESDLGVFTVKDLDRLWETGAVEIDTLVVNRAQLTHIVTALDAAGTTQALHLPRRIIEHLDTILAICGQHWDESLQPDYSALKRPLQRLVTLFTPEEEAAQADTALPLPDDMPLALASRADAIRCLKRVCQFIEHSEPTNPAPLLIRRAIAVMGMNFMDIVKHIAPDGLNQAMFITGVEASSDDEPSR